MVSERFLPARRRADPVAFVRRLALVEDVQKQV
jgi:hypothetical protein